MSVVSTISMSEVSSVSTISAISTMTVIVSVPSFRICFSLGLGLAFGLTLLSFWIDNCGLFFGRCGHGIRIVQTIGIRIMVSVGQSMSVCQWSMSYGMGICDGMGISDGSCPM